MNRTGGGIGTPDVPNGTRSVPPKGQAGERRKNPASGQPIMSRSSKHPEHPKRRPKAPVKRLSKPPAPDAIPAVARTYEGFISREEVAKRLTIHTRTVDRWMNWRILTYYRIAHTVMFKWSEVEAFLVKHYRMPALDEAEGRGTETPNTNIQTPKAE